MKIVSLSASAGCLRGLATRSGLALALLLTLGAPVGAGTASPPGQDSGIRGPFHGELVYPHSVNVRDLPVATGHANPHPNPLPFRQTRPNGNTISTIVQQQAEKLNLLPSVLHLDHEQSSDDLPGGPTPLAGWQGINSVESDCGCLPPDGDIAVGPHHILVGVNLAFKIFDKSGQQLLGPVQYDDFFNGCGPSGLSSSDPFAAYDPVADRFINGILRYTGTVSYDSYVSIGVSQTNDPTGGWYTYCYYQGSGNLYDFPQVAVWHDAIYTTGDVFDAVTFQNARVNAYDKQAMYTGQPNSQVYYDVGNDAAGNAADHLDPALGTNILPNRPEYFINADDCTGLTCNTISLWRWRDPFGANVFELAGGVQVTPYKQTVPMLQRLGAPVPLAVYIDFRNLDAAWYNDTLYGVHSIGCTPSLLLVDCIQWYQLGNINGTPRLLQQGIKGSATGYRTYPDLSVDKAGNLVIGYAYSCATCYIGIRATGRLATDPRGRLQSEITVKRGEQPVLMTLRWGDYAGDVLDPDGCTHWHFEEYMGNTGDWSTWVSSSTYAPDHCTPGP